MKTAKPAVNPEFQKCIDRAGNQSALARKIGVRQQTINDIARGEQAISLAMALKLTNLFKDLDVKAKKLKPDFEW